jgi:hypothetical protein
MATDDRSRLLHRLPRHDGLHLATGETARVNLQVQLRAVADAVIVTADAPLLRSETSGLGHVIDNRKITASSGSRAGSPIW